MIAIHSKLLDIFSSTCVVAKGESEIKVIKAAIIGKMNKS